jgi:hypothetical protein
MPASDPGLDGCLTGPPRSGTTLVCHYLNKLPNVVALHEPIVPRHYEGLGRDEFLEKLKAYFATEREQILTVGTATSKSRDGKIPPNTLSDEVVDGARIVLRNSMTLTVTNVDRPDFALFIKDPSFMTGCLPWVAGEFPCFASVRNPLSTLLSWRNSNMPVARGRIPSAEMFSPELKAILNDDNCPVLDKQFAILHFFFGRFREFLPGRVVRYEDVIASGGKALSLVHPSAATLREPLESRNEIRITADPEARAIADRLLDSEGPWWDHYTKDDVHRLLQRLPDDPASRK